MWFRFGERYPSPTTPREFLNQIEIGDLNWVEGNYIGPPIVMKSTNLDNEIILDDNEVEELDFTEEIISEEHL